MVEPGAMPRVYVRAGSALGAPVGCNRSVHCEVTRRSAQNTGAGRNDEGERKEEEEEEEEESLFRADAVN